MSFLTWLFGSPNHEGVTTNDAVSDPTSVGPQYNPGDPDGFELVGFDDDFESRSLPSVLPSAWSGWPASWDVPSWGHGSQVGKLVDAAWSCIDLNARVLAAMPPYRVAGGTVRPALPWMSNPDPAFYTSWVEFAKQLFWDFQLGEAFVMASNYHSDGYPMYMRVIPPWAVTVDMFDARRRYRIGSLDVSEHILHIRYQSTTSDVRGHGPLESAGARIVAAGVLGKYIAEIASQGGVPPVTIYSDEELSFQEATDLREQYYAARINNLGKPAVVDNAAKIETHTVNAKDLALIEIAQFSESRIAVLCGVPPFLAGLPSGGDSMTYSTTESLFDFHWRAGLKPSVAMVMQALSNWALPRGQSIELNRDEYVEPAFGERVEAYAKLNAIEDESGPAITVQEIRDRERFTSDVAAAALTGGGRS